MTLIDDVQAVCRRLAPQGWADLLAQHGLDITAADPIGHCKLFLVLVLRAIYTSTKQPTRTTANNHDAFLG
jgi:hypothetical protein